MYVNIQVLILLALIHLATSAKILMVFPTLLPSHFILGEALAKGLANAGHEITMVSPIESNDPTNRGKYKTVLLDGMKEVLMNSHQMPSWREMGVKGPLYTELFLFNIPGAVITNFTLRHPNFQKLIHSNETFDVIILQQFLNDALKALNCHYKIPLILFSTLDAGFWINPLVGNPSPPSYLPDIFLSYSTKMTLWQRTYNSFFTLIKYINSNYVTFPMHSKMVKETFPECYPDFYETLYNASLTFINSHESISYAKPFVPSMIPIGGYYLNPPKKLPDDLQTFMDEAKEGVIYFSLGSNILSSSIGTVTENTIMKVFGKLKQKVLWKWDEEIVEGKPDNIKIQKWFPQHDVLAHPNVKLFITHGGLLSITEMLYHGIPALCIGIFADQKLNCAKMENDGFGLSIPLDELSEENFAEALEKLLNDSKYQENAKRKSTYLHDRPIKPMDLAIYWTEFVIKHKGAQHLRVAGLDLKWHQYLLLDVIAVVIIILFTFLAIIYYLIKILLRKLRKPNKLKVN